MKKIFKTSIDDLEILEHIIEYIDENYLKLILEQNLILRHHCNADNLKKYRFNREIVENKTIELCKKNIDLRGKILILWGKRLSNTTKCVENAEDVNVIIDKLKKKSSLEQVFEYCTVLWQKNDEKDNLAGDDLYELYKEKKGKEVLDKDINLEVEDKEEINMDIMSISLGECIQSITKAKSEQEDTKVQLLAKEKEVEELKSKLHLIIDNRELKKEIKVLARNISEIEKTFKEESNQLRKDISAYKKENESLKSGIEDIYKVVKQFKVDNIVKMLIENQNQINNSLKGSIIESVQKNNEAYLKIMEDRITERINEIEVVKVDNSETIVQVEPVGPSIQPSRGVTLQEQNFDELLDGLML